MPKISINNVSFHYELSGNGHPLVLISGYACDHTFWDPIIEKLNRNFQVLRFDNRACGQTVDYEQNLTLKLMADDVMALCSALNVKRPHIIGHSLGGMIAQQIGILYGKEINKLGLLSCSLKVRLPIIQCFESFLSMRQKKYPFDDIFYAAIPWFYGEEFLKDKETIEALRIFASTYPYRQSIQNEERQLRILLQCTDITKSQVIKSHTLIMYGKQDIIVLPNDVQHMASFIPHKTIIDCDAAHGMILEIPGPVGEIISQFLLDED